ncbi:MAG TPA: hypothetical protein ACFE0H_15800 [Elainellaceae cyanobacterium]
MTIHYVRPRRHLTGLLIDLDFEPNAGFVALPHLDSPSNHPVPS